MAQETVLVIGGTGLVGNALVRAWRCRGVRVLAATYHCHPGPHFTRLDMQDAASVAALLGAERPDIVAVPAANPHVDFCELHAEETRRVNVEGTLNVARACRSAGAQMIFYSSDYVFDGLAGPYSEEDAPRPINEYGRQKAEAERGVLAADPRNLVIRTSGAYGWQWEPKNFVLQVLARLGKGQAMKVADDVKYNPTYAENLAEVTADLASTGRSGIYHVVGAEALPRYEFARLAAEEFGLDARLIEPVPSSSFPQGVAPRPRSTALKTDKVRALALSPLVGAREGLERMKALREAWTRYAEAELPRAPQ